MKRYHMSRKSEGHYVNEKMGEDVASKNNRKNNYVLLTDGQIRHIVLYGAGYGGLMFLELLRHHGIEPECFLDISPQKQGRTIMGIPVFGPDKKWIENAIVVVCLLRMDDVWQEIKAGMLELGCKRVFHLYELRENRELFKDQPLIISPDRDLIWGNRTHLYQVYRMLEDRQSRQVFSAILSFLWSDLGVSIPSLPLEDQYFADDIYSLGENEIFVDCGAHTGEILQQFLQRCKGRFHTYWAFEPDIQNVHLLEKTIPEQFRQQVFVHHTALGDRPSEVRIRNYDGNNSVIREDGEESAPCVTLDSFAVQLHPTILKIDVEGWESRLLAGAEKIICRYKPVIAIATYHKEQDFWELPLLLKHWVPEYRLYLRSYLNVAETVLYAVPPERTVKESML